MPNGQPRRQPRRVPRAELLRLRGEHVASRRPGEDDRVVRESSSAVNVVAVAVLAAAAVARHCARSPPTQPTDGALSVLVALVLAPARGGRNGALGSCAAGDRFGLAAAARVRRPAAARQPADAADLSLHVRCARPAVARRHAAHRGLRARRSEQQSPACSCRERAAAAAGLVAFVVARGALAVRGCRAPAVRRFTRRRGASRSLEWLPIAGMLAGLLASACAGRQRSAAGCSPSCSWAAHRGYDGAVFWRSLRGRVPAAALRAQLAGASGATAASCRSPSGGSKRSTELELEQRDALGEDHVLVRDLRDHGRVVQQHGEHEEQRDREEHRGRIGLHAEPAGDRVQAATPRRQRRAARAPSAPRAARTARAGGASGSARRRRRAAGATRRDAATDTLERRLAASDHASSSGVARRRSAPTKIASITFAM